jgi:enoyl-CoA hydratase
MSEEAQPEYVTYDVKDGVAWVMLNRPQYSNAQNYRLLGQLDDAFKRAVEDDEVKVIVLGGEGKHFSAGHDIGTPEKDSHMPRIRTSMWWDHLNKGGAERQYVLEQDGYLGLCRRWQEIPKPMIAMVQGACIAGGLMLAWVCDLIFRPCVRIAASGRTGAAVTRKAHAGAAGLSVRHGQRDLPARDAEGGSGQDSCRDRPA